MAKYVIGIFFLILIGAGAYYYFFMGGELPQQAPPQEEVVVPQVSTYATTSFSVVYPNDFQVDPNHVYDQVNPAKPIFGVRFTVPTNMATGTNLSSDSYVSVETLPRAQNCTGDIYVAANVPARAVQDTGVAYSVATTSGAAAGNRYEEQVWALAGSKPCVAIRYFIHTTAIENYEPGAVRAYDHAALIAAFDEIRRGVRLAGAAPAATSTATSTSTSAQ